MCILLYQIQVQSLASPLHSSFPYTNYSLRAAGKTQLLASYAVMGKVRACGTTKLRGGPAAEPPENTSHGGIFLVRGRLSWKGWDLTEIWIFSNTKVCPKILCKTVHSTAKQNHPM